MNQEQALSLLKETKLVAILRGIPVKQATDIATALYDGGVRVLEFTFDHDDPDCVAHNCQRIRAKDLCRRDGGWLRHGADRAGSRSQR